MKILVIEDDADRIKKFKSELVGHDVDYATTSAEAIALVTKERYDLAFFDHDLGGNVMVESDGEFDTGFKVAKHLHGTGGYIPKHSIIHSLNAHGAENIRSMLTSVEDAVGVHAVCIPFIRLDISGAAQKVDQYLRRYDAK